MKTTTKFNPLITQFDLHQRLYNNVLVGFTDEETNRRLPGYPHISHIKYIAGHLLNSQYGIAMLAGLKTEVKWNDLFAVMGQSEARDDISYPHIDEIMKEWNDLYRPVREKLYRMNDDQLMELPPEPFDAVSESKGQLWTFITHHQAYHIGQIGILRRAFGKDPMSYE
ncbi:MAG: DinB family protein [Balneolaceae bacterium]|nr:DinB family protein [Balneolaceae bacterium]